MANQQINNMQKSFRCRSWALLKLG